MAGIAFSITSIIVTIAAAVLYGAVPTVAPMYMKIGDIEGESTDTGHQKWINIESMSMPLTRSTCCKESGEKGGTEDLNIGIGELQECTLSKSMDRASPELFKRGLSGEAIPNCQIQVCPTDPVGQMFCYYNITMERCYVKDMTTSKKDGDSDVPVEEVALYFNKIRFDYKATPDGTGPRYHETMSWDNVKNKPWGADPGSRGPPGQHFFRDHGQN